MGAADEEPRAVAGSLPMRSVDRRFPGMTLAALLGNDAPDLSPAVILRLTAEWHADYDAWQSAISRHGDTCTCARTGSTFRPGWIHVRYPAFCGLNGTSPQVQKVPTAEITLGYAVWEGQIGRWASAVVPGTPDSRYVTRKSRPKPADPNG